MARKTLWVDDMRELILFHGTADYNLDSFVADGPRKKFSSHVKKECFCTSTELSEAEFFALRKTPANDLTKTGIVLEYHGVLMFAGTDYIMINDRTALRYEHECCVFNVKKLHLAGVWRCKNRRRWVREAFQRSLHALRASGDVECYVCAKKYYDHPDYTEELDFQGDPFLKEICDGRLVKL